MSAKNLFIIERREIDKGRGVVVLIKRLKFFCPVLFTLIKVISDDWNTFSLF